MTIPASHFIVDTHSRLLGGSILFVPQPLTCGPILVPKQGALKLEAADDGQVSVSVHAPLMEDLARRLGIGWD